MCGASVYAASSEQRAACCHHTIKNLCLTTSHMSVVALCLVSVPIKASFQANCLGSSVSHTDPVLVLGLRRLLLYYIYIYTYIYICLYPRS